MNYLSHGFRFVDDPYFVAGTALPDWMNVVDRRNRSRSHLAQPWAQADDPAVAAFARGVLQHHHDDHWFHQNATFTQLWATFAVQLRPLVSLSHQAGFLGHISVELLLDAVLMEDVPGRLDAYYNALAQVDPQRMRQIAELMLPRPAERLEWLLPRFIAERFLADYPDDLALWRRLNHVMRRVGLEPLGEQVVPWLATARQCVRQSADLLLTDSNNTSIRMADRDPRHNTQDTSESNQNEVRDEPAAMDRRTQ